MKKVFIGMVLALLIATPAIAGVAITVDPVRDTKAMLASFTSTTAVETSATFQVSTNAGALTTAAGSYTVTAGKTLKVQSLSAACSAGGSSPAASTATLKFKVNGVQQGQGYQVACPTTTTASAASFPSLPLLFPHGIDYPAGAVISFTLTLTAWTVTTNTPILDLTLMGYEF